MKIDGSGISGEVKKRGSAYSWRARKDVRMQKVGVLRPFHPLYPAMWEMSHLFPAAVSKTTFRRNGTDSSGNERRWPASELA
jgi:hypothetical protein